MSSRPLDPMLIAVGQSLGALYTDDDVPVRRVRLADRVFSLTPELATAWDLARLPDPERQGGLSRAALLAYGDEVAGDLAAPLGALLDAGLVAEVSLLDGEVVEFARFHRMAALMHSIGNAPERLDDYAFGIGEDGFALTGGLMHEVIVRAAAFRSIEDLAVALAPAMHTNSSTVHLAEPAALIDLIVRNLPSFLAANAIYVDSAVMES